MAQPPVSSSTVPDLPPSEVELDLALPVEAANFHSEPLPPRTPIASGVLILLDPRDITIPPTPNRLPEAFRSQGFYELRDSIAASGVNLEPILVRELADRRGYVLVFGEMRLRACLELGLRVKVMLADSGTEASDYLKRLQENLGSTTLSNWEFGIQVLHMMAAREGMTRVNLADLLGVSVAKISRAYDLGNLPDAVVRAFQSPNDIRIQDVKPLRDAWAMNADAVSAEASLIEEEGDGLKATEVVRRLSASAMGGREPDGFAPCKPPPRKDGPQSLKCGDRSIGDWLIGDGGTLEVRIDIAMSEAQRDALLEMVGSFAQRKVLTSPKSRAFKPTKPSNEPIDAAGAEALAASDTQPAMSLSEAA